MPTENKMKLKQTNRPIRETSIKWIRIKNSKKGTLKKHTLVFKGIYNAA